jgi:hypothetical protein
MTETLTERDEFLDLVLADDDFVRAEFAAIVDGFHDFDDEPPTRPARRGRPSRRPGRPRRRVRLCRPRTYRPLLPGRARQRSPPLAHRARRGDTERGGP